MKKLEFRKTIRKFVRGIWQSLKAVVGSPPTIIVNEVAQQRKRKCATAGLAEAIQCRVASDVGFQDRKGLRLGGDGATVTTMAVFG